MRNSRMKPVTAAVGTAFVASLAAASFADTTGNPFGAEELAHGYNLLAEQDDKEGEGKCGEGSCGEETKPEAAQAGYFLAEESGDDKDAEGKCGEGKCGEGSCGGTKG